MDIQKLIGYLARKAARAHCKSLRSVGTGVDPQRLQRAQEQTLRAFSSSWPMAYRDLFIESYRTELKNLCQGLRA